MPSLAFNLEVLSKVVDQLVTQGDAHGTLMKDNAKFAALGAIGPDLLRYLPVSAELIDQLSALTDKQPTDPKATPVAINTLPFTLLEELFLNPVGAAYALLYRKVVVPHWPTINQINGFLDKLDAIAAAQNELAIPGVLGELQTVTSGAKTLASDLQGVTVQTAFVIGQIIALPPWMEQSQSNIPATPADPRANRLSEFLRWHKSGDLADNLLKAATTDQEKAFALGWLTHVASAVTGEPFINNITGGPYRTHWWRNRLVGNFVNSWTFGFFNTGPTTKMTGDNPTPAYADWKPLCTANLQHAFNVAGLADGAGDDVPASLKAVASGNLGALTGQFPAAIADLLEKAVNETYPSATQPIAGFSADTFRNAFVGTFSVAWFMTSGSGPMGLNTLGAAPVTCTTAPTWISSGSTPSPQQAGVNIPGAVCAALLAIFAALLFLFGDIPGGLTALAGALAAPAIDWAKVTCNLFWLRNTLVTAENALRDALVQSALAYPPPAKLGTIDVSDQTHPALDKTVPTGVALTKTNSLNGSATAVGFDGVGYPRTMDSSASAPDLNFAAFPNTATEQPHTVNMVPSNRYPDLVVGGPTGAGLLNGGIVNTPTFPSANHSFGDAVSNAVALIKQGAGKLPNYNLDGDRGYGWEGWHPEPASTPSAPPVNAVQDA